MQVIQETTFRTSYKKGSKNSTDTVQGQLKTIIKQYLSENPRLTLNGLSQRCSVSEPTLRRICKGQIKTTPTVTTVVDILSYILKTQNVSEIASEYPGPIAELLKEKSNQTAIPIEPVYSEGLNNNLKDPLKFMIYKMASHTHGVKAFKVVSLFGNHGLMLADELLEQGLLTKLNECFFANVSNFIVSDELFIDHFKAFADFIKPHKLATTSRAHSPLFANYSASVNKQTYANIVKIQRQALKKMARLLQDPNNAGNIPSFVLSAVDTIDQKAADEIV